MENDFLETLITNMSLNTETKVEKCVKLVSVLVRDNMPKIFESHYVSDCVHIEIASLTDP